MFTNGMKSVHFTEAEEAANCAYITIPKPKFPVGTEIKPVHDRRKNRTPLIVIKTMYEYDEQKPMWYYYVGKLKTDKSQVIYNEYEIRLA
jgi:hypothetical protein